MPNDKDYWRALILYGKNQNKTLGRQTYVEQEVDNLKAGVQNREKTITIIILFYINFEFLQIYYIILIIHIHQ